MIVPSLRNGGTERAVSRISKSFEQKGFEVLVITFSKGINDYPLSHHLELGVEASKNILNKSVNVLRRSSRLKKIKLVFKPNVSISFMFGANLVNAITKINQELVITSIRSTIKYENRIVFSKFLNSIVYRLSDYVVPVSKGVGNEILDKYKINPEKIKVIYNFVDIAVSVILKEILKSSIRLITMGRLEEVKAQWHLIHAVNTLRDKYPTLVLNILGQGELFEKYQGLISELKLEQHVILHGFQDDIEHYLSISDIFCLSSRNEGMPNVLLEAMNQGLPIISTDIPHGPREVLNPSEIDLYGNDEIMTEEKYGLLVDYGNNPKSNEFGYRDEYIVNQFVERIKLLIEKKALYEHYSKQSLKRVQDFSEETIISQWIELFEEGMKHS